MRELAEKYAELNGLDPTLVLSVIWRESRGNRFAVRYEDNFYLRYVSMKIRSDLIGYVPKQVVISLDTEKRLRAHSIGVMQTMGQTAREFGYAKDSLLELTNEEDSIQIGCKILAYKIRRAGDIAGGLLAYNGGGNLQYAEEVLGFQRTKAYEGLP